MNTRYIGGILLLLSGLCFWRSSPLRARWFEDKIIRDLKPMDEDWLRSSEYDRGKG